VSVCVSEWVCERERVCVCARVCPSFTVYCAHFYDSFRLCRNLCFPEGLNLLTDGYQVYVNIVYVQVL
jgi:hypothetical protein